MSGNFFMREKSKVFTFFRFFYTCESRTRQTKEYFSDFLDIFCSTEKLRFFSSSIFHYLNLFSLRRMIAVQFLLFSLFY